MLVAEQTKRSLNIWVFGWAIGALLFALVVTWQNRGLTFFWDEWHVVEATVESPYFGVLQDNGGNFFPLSRIVFGLEVVVFGTWYPGYMFVTSLLFGATALAFNILLDNGTTVRRITLSAFSLIYLSSTGVLFASSMGFMLIWGLSPLLATISAAFFIRSQSAPDSRKKWLAFAWLFFFLTWASFSSSIVIMALLIIGIIHLAPHNNGDLKSQRLYIRLSVLIMILSLVAVLVGIRLAQLNPPANPLAGTAQGSIDSLFAQDFVATSALALASTLAGLFSTIIAMPLHSNELNSWLIIAVSDYIWIVIGLLTLIIALIYWRRKAFPDKYLWLTFSLYLAANIFIAAARTPFIHRYQTLLVLIAILVFISLFDWLERIKLSRLRNFILAAVIVAACLSVWHIGTSALTIGNIERQRDVANSAILNDPMLCFEEANRTLDQIAPSMNPQSLCTLLVILNERSWISQR